jgi:hypothetical protein
MTIFFKEYFYKFLKFTFTIDDAKMYVFVLFLVCSRKEIRGPLLFRSAFGQSSCHLIHAL